MAGKMSAAHKRARKLIENGMDVGKACTEAGISTSAIYQSQWYAQLRGTEHAPRSNRCVSEETIEARDLIEGGMSVKGACEIAKVSPSTIYRSPWFKARGAEQ